MDKSLPMETGCTSKQNENDQDQHSYSNTDPNWVFKFNIPWDLMPKALFQSINKSERPSAQLRRQMVRIIVSHIHAKCKNPRKKHMEIIAMKIVEQYPMSFQDKIDQMIVGSGWDSLQRQLTLRSENINREIHPAKRKYSSALSDSTNIQRNNIRDSYGCVNWQPEEPDCDDSDAVDFHAHRCLINGGTPLAEIKCRYPKLFEKEGLLSHFKNLVNIDLMQSLESGLSTKGQRIFKFMKNCSLDRIKLVMKKFENLEANNDCTLDEKPSVIINLLEAYFKEDGVLFRIFEVSSKK